MSFFVFFDALRWAVRTLTRGNRELFPYRELKRVAFALGIGMNQAAITNNREIHLAEILITDVKTGIQGGVVVRFDNRQNAFVSIFQKASECRCNSHGVQVLPAVSGMSESLVHVDILICETDDRAVAASALARREVPGRSSRVPLVSRELSITRDEAIAAITLLKCLLDESSGKFIFRHLSEACELIRSKEGPTIARRGREVFRIYRIQPHAVKDLQKHGTVEAPQGDVLSGFEQAVLLQPSFDLSEVK